MDSCSVATSAAITNDNPSLIIRHGGRGRGSSVVGAVRLLVVVDGGNLGAAESLHAAGIVVRCVLWVDSCFTGKSGESWRHPAIFVQCDVLS